MSTWYLKDVVCTEEPEPVLEKKINLEGWMDDVWVAAAIGQRIARDVQVVSTEIQNKFSNAEEVKNDTFPSWANWGLGAVLKVTKTGLSLANLYHNLGVGRTQQEANSMFQLAVPVREKLWKQEREQHKGGKREIDWKIYQAPDDDKKIAKYEKSLSRIFPEDSVVDDIEGKCFAEVEPEGRAESDKFYKTSSGEILWSQSSELLILKAKPGITQDDVLEILDDVVGEVDFDESVERAIDKLLAN